MASHTYPADHPDDGSLLGDFALIARRRAAMGPRTVTPRFYILADDLLADARERAPFHPEDVLTMGAHRRAFVRDVVARMAVLAGFTTRDLLPVLMHVDPLLHAVADAAEEARASEGKDKTDALDAYDRAVVALAKDARL